MNVSSSKIESSGITHIGPVREENQDSICLFDNFNHGGASFFAVADGMGGYSHGKMASNMAIDALCETFKEEDGSPLQRLTRGVEAANFNIYQVTQKLGVGRMGTTLTAAYLEGRRLTVVHVGDSRLYLLRGKQVTCLTRDHTVVGDLVRMKVLTPDKVRTHAQRSVLTRGVGLAPFVHADITHHMLKEGDRLILCSDGLWSVIEDEELPLLSEQTGEMSTLVNRLLYLAIERGTDDNISAVGVHVQSLSPETQSNRPGWQWFRSLVRPF
ncbi:MAG: protein phosphatase 2C domain-containing protein [Anaerolineae bacterium]|nr:protein phosphatase 2C domain-containing protein [Anaerolineae bacterium]